MLLIISWRDAECKNWCTARCDNTCLNPRSALGVCSSHCADKRGSSTCGSEITIASFSQEPKIQDSSALFPESSCTESQNSVGQLGPLEIIYSVIRAGSVRGGFLKGCAPLRFENLQAQTFHGFCWQSVSVLDHPHDKNVFSCI